MLIATHSSSGLIFSFEIHSKRKSPTLLWRQHTFFSNSSVFGGPGVDNSVKQTGQKVRLTISNDVFLTYASAKVCFFNSLLWSGYYGKTIENMIRSDVNNTGFLCVNVTETKKTFSKTWSKQFSNIFLKRNFRYSIGEKYITWRV